MVSIEIQTLIEKLVKVIRFRLDNDTKSDDQDHEDRYTYTYLYNIEEFSFTGKFRFCEYQKNKISCRVRKLCNLLNSIYEEHKNHKSNHKPGLITDKV
jgi:hypothetical protein